MVSYIQFADRLSAWVGKAFAWVILVMTFGICYEVFMRYLLRAPTTWAFDISYMMYGTMFMMAGAYALSRDTHVRADFIYRLWQPKTQATVELILYFLFFFPGILALIFAGWRYASRAWRYGEVSVYSPAGIPIYHFKMVIVAAGVLLFIQGVAQVFRCILCMRSNIWSRPADDVQELEKVLMEAKSLEVLHHGSEPVDVPHSPVAEDAARRDRQP